MDRYNFILEKWDTDIELFFDFIEHICGFQANSKVYNVLKREIYTMEDLKYWIAIFDGDIDSIEETTDTFIKSKRMIGWFGLTPIIFLK